MKREEIGTRELKRWIPPEAAISHLKRISSAVFLTAIAASGAGARGSITFADGTFVDSNWSAAKIGDTTDNQTASYSTQQVASGGNPDDYQQTTLQYDFGGGQGVSQGVTVAQMDLNATYNPSASGAFSSVSFSIDGIGLNESNGAGVYERPVVLQDGTYYTGPTGLPEPAIARSTARR